MATRGLKQLTRLKLYYCEYGGSSKAVREYLANGRLAAWATKYPDVEIDVTPRNGKHPFVEGEYRTRAASHQISVKNYEKWRHVEEVMDVLRNRSGRKITKITTPVLTDTPSIQGVWTPFLNLQNIQSFRVQIVPDNQS
jgi:large subunit ribosomal protein L43